METGQADQVREKNYTKREQTLGMKWHHQANNTCITEISYREDREKKAENVFEKIIAKNFPNLGKEIEIQIKDA